MLRQYTHDGAHSCARRRRDGTHLYALRHGVLDHNGTAVVCAAQVRVVVLRAHKQHVEALGEAGTRQLYAREVSPDRGKQVECGERAVDAGTTPTACLTVRLTDNTHRRFMGCCKPTVALFGSVLGMLL